jgi:hypothetical protein
VTGYFDSATGLDQGTGEPLFRCAFYLTGKLVGHRASITTWFPRDGGPTIRGTLEVAEALADRTTVSVGLESEHGGCWNVQRFADPQPAVFFRDAPGEWIGVRVVGASRARFYAEPDGPFVGKTYAVRGDLALVLARTSGWVRARVHETVGWLREFELYGDAPPYTGHAVPLREVGSPR